MKLRLALIATFAASPVLAAPAGTPFFSLYNTDIVVAIGFVLFVGILVYFKVPQLINGLLDKRAETIRSELEEARKLREEAQELRASFERKKTEVKAQAERIVAKARVDAELAAKQARVDLEASITRRIRAAEDQIASAEAGALREVRNKAVAVAVTAAADLIARNMSPDEAGKLIDSSISTVEARLN